jgi:hypothetical protein
MPLSLSPLRKRKRQNQDWWKWCNRTMRRSCRACTLKSGLTDMQRADLCSRCVCVCVIEFPGDGWCSLAGFAWVYGNECVALAAALCVAWNRAGLWFGSVVPSLTSGCVSYPSFAVTLFRARLRTLSDCVREKQVLQASLPTIRLH